MALIAVLWITSLLALMAAGIGSSGRISAKLAFNGLESSEARLAADGGVHQAIYMLLGAEQQRPWQAGGVLAIVADVSGTLVRIAVRDVDGKIDINRASNELLRSLFLSLDVNDAEATALAETIIEARGQEAALDAVADSEDQREDSEGRTADDTPSRPFQSLSDLRDLPGMPEPLYRRLAPLLTIYKDDEALDPLRASKETLNALPGMTSTALEAILSIQRAVAEDPSRASSAEEDLADYVGPFEDYVASSRDRIFEIIVSAESDGGGRFVRSAVVDLGSGKDDTGDGDDTGGAENEDAEQTGDEEDDEDAPDDEGQEEAEDGTGPPFVIYSWHQEGQQAR